MGGSMKQTGVEWLVEQICRKQDLTYRDIDKAKEIEKENMINFLKSVFQQDGFDYEKAFEQFKTK